MALIYSSAESVLVRGVKLEAEETADEAEREEELLQVRWRWKKPILSDRFRALSFLVRLLSYEVFLGCWCGRRKHFQPTWEKRWLREDARGGLFECSRKMEP